MERNRDGLAPEGQRPSLRRRAFELAFTVAVALILIFAVQSYAVKPFKIPSGSMEPTLEVGERVLVDRFSTRLGSNPQIGDVIVFHPPRRRGCAEPAGEAEARDRPCPVPGRAPADEDYIKRVVAGPGDRLQVLDGIPVVDGEPIEGDWATVPCDGAPGCDLPAAITIPADHYFVMGDNRPNSSDSRYWGPVPSSWIVGKAFATYWPPDQAGGL